MNKTPKTTLPDNLDISLVTLNDITMAWRPESMEAFDLSYIDRVGYTTPLSGMTIDEYYDWFHHHCEDCFSWVVRNVNIADTRYGVCVNVKGSTIPIVYCNESRCPLRCFREAIRMAENLSSFFSSSIIFQHGFDDAKSMMVFLRVDDHEDATRTRYNATVYKTKKEDGATAFQIEFNEGERVDFIDFAKEIISEIDKEYIMYIPYVDHDENWRMYRLDIKRDFAGE